MKPFPTCLAATFFGIVASVAQPSEKPHPVEPSKAFRLWTADAPRAHGTTPKDIPTLTPFLPKPDLASGAAIIVCPGSGYSGLAAHEGSDYARWLADNGVAAFVLTYRLGSAGYRYPTQLEDAARAIRTVRDRATEWSVDPHRVGIIGSSAGGHLASTLLTHFDAGQPEADDPVERQSSRPDLGILCYPVITMGEKTHAGSMKNLLGDNPPEGLIREVSNELHVTKDTPPCFIFHTVEDQAVPIENSFLFASALRKAGVPFSFHSYETGAHGMGLGYRPYATYEPGKLHPWTTNCIFWLRDHKFVK